jgi:hypothetical protein
MLPRDTAAFQRNKLGTWAAEGSVQASQAPFTWVQQCRSPPSLLQEDCETNHAAPVLPATAFQPPTPTSISGDVMGGPNALTENDFAPSSQVQIESAVEFAASNLEKGHGDASLTDGANVNGANTNGADAKADGFLEVVKETGKGKVNVPTVICKSA